MKILCAAAFAITVFAVVGSAAEPVAADGTIISTTRFKLPPYTDAERIQPYATKSEYDAIAADATYELNRVVYASDGLPVVAYTYAPAVTPAKPLPTVVFNRGSYTQGEIAPQILPLFHRLALHGFAVIAPLYRGSAGAPGVDEMGGAELHDLLNVQRLIPGLEFVDRSNLFLYGESRGGMMTLLAVKSGFPARAAATFGAFSDLGALMAAAPERYEPLTRQIWPDFPTRRDEILRSRSAQAWPEALTVPLLLMHGGADRDVDPLQTLQLSMALQKLGRPYELRIFAGDNHVLTNHRVERDEAAAAWFTAHLQEH